MTTIIQIIQIIAIIGIIARSISNTNSATIHGLSILPIFNLCGMRHSVESDKPKSTTTTRITINRLDFEIICDDIPGLGENTMCL